MTLLVAKICDLCSEDAVYIDLPNDPDGGQPVCARCLGSRLIGFEMDKGNVEPIED